ncbi:MAG: glycosyltransferase family 39 protein, partial [Chloroflexota bacterium]
MQYFKSRTSLTIIWILLVVANGLVTVHYLTSGAAWFAGAATATSAAILFYLRQNKNVSLSPSGPVFYGLYAGFFFLLASAIVTGAPPIIVAGILLTALTSLNTVFSQQEQTNWRVITLFITFVILFSFVVRAFSLSVYPSYNYHDEPWILSFIVGYIEEGMFVDRIMLGLDPEITTWAMPKHYIPVAWWMELAGIGIWQGRFYHMMLAVVTTLLTAITAGKLYNRKVALFTALFMAGSTVLTFTFQFRHEAPLTLSIAASLLCFSLATERNNNWLHLLAGMVMGAGGFGHLNAALFGGVMLVGLYTPLWITRLRQQLWWPPRSMIAYGVGGMVSGLLVLWIVVLPDYEHLAHYYAPRVTEEGNNFLVGTGIHLTNIMLHSITEFALLLIALVVAARRSMQSDWSLIVIFSMGILVLGIASPAGIF